MNSQDINNHFGDMDLFLMDVILKGKVPKGISVLDIGCGEGRNGIYFIKEGYDYLGVDIDISKIRLIEHLSKSLGCAKARFEAVNILHVELVRPFDLIICSRVLHFAENEVQFMKMWSHILHLLASTGIIYLSMDSVVENTVATLLENGKYQFPDGGIRYALDTRLFEKIKKGFEELEPLRTVIHHRRRAQSFMLLRRV